MVPTPLDTVKVTLVREDDGTRTWQALTKTKNVYHPNLQAYSAHEMRDDGPVQAAIEAYISCGRGERYNADQWEHYLRGGIVDDEEDDDPEYPEGLYHTVVDICIRLAKTHPARLHNYQSLRQEEDGGSYELSTNGNGDHLLNRLWICSQKLFGTLWGNPTVIQQKTKNERTTVTRDIVETIGGSPLKKGNPFPLVGYDNYKEAETRCNLYLSGKCDIENLKVDCNYSSPFYNDKGWKYRASTTLDSVQPGNEPYNYHFVALSRTHPEKIFEKAAVTPSNKRRTRKQSLGTISVAFDQNNTLQNQWLGATAVLGDLWHNGVTPHADTRKPLESTAPPTDVDLTPPLKDLAKRRGTKRKQDDGTEVWAHEDRGVVKCDSNDDYEDRGLSNTETEIYPQSDGARHNTNFMTVEHRDRKYEFSGKFGYDSLSTCFPPNVHVLEKTHGILTVGVHGFETDTRDESFWSPCGTKDSVQSNNFRKQIAARCLISEDNVIFRPDQNPVLMDEAYIAACKANPIMAFLRDYPVWEKGEIPEKFYKSIMGADVTVRGDGKKKNNSWLRFYHHAQSETSKKLENFGVCHPCHLPGRLSNTKHSTHPMTGCCMCTAVVAVGGKGGMEDHPYLKWEEVHGSTQILLPFREQLHKSATHRDKETFVRFKIALVETRELSCNNGKFVIIGTDVQPRSTDGICPGIPPLCLDGLAGLVGKYVHWGKDMEDEVMFTKTFVEGCLKRGPNKQDLESADGIPTIGTFYHGSDKLEGKGYRAMEMGQILFHHACAVIAMNGNSITEEEKPQIPSDFELFMHWQMGDAYPLTKSILLKPQTFVTYMVDVKKIFSNNEYKGRFTIAHYNINYISGTAGTKTVVKLNNPGTYAYKTGKYHTTEKRHSVDKIWAVRLATEIRDLLVGLTTEGLGGNVLPTRRGQMFFGRPMDPFHSGMRTFFSCDAFGGFEVTENGLYNLLKGGIETRKEEDAENQLWDFVESLVEEGRKQCYGGGDDGSTGDDYLVRVAASLRQSRFDTYSKERTAPLTEMTCRQHDDMERNGGKCVHALVPLSSDGLFIRFFYNRHDKEGTLIKVMPDTILLFPSTAIMEYGRLTHIDGHRHLILKIQYTKKTSGRETEAAFDMETAEREYPHMENTVAKMEDDNGGELPENWEKDFRYLTYPGLATNPKDRPALEFLESLESEAVDTLHAK